MLTFSSLKFDFRQTYQKKLVFNDTPEENHNSWWLKLVPESVSETLRAVWKIFRFGYRLEPQ